MRVIQNIGRMFGGEVRKDYTCTDSSLHSAGFAAGVSERIAIWQDSRPEMRRDTQTEERGGGKRGRRARAIGRDTSTPAVSQVQVGSGTRNRRHGAAG